MGLSHQRVARSEDTGTCRPGLLTGFGGFWTLLMARQSSSGGTPDNSTWWLAVGIVPLATGLALLGLVAWQELARRPEIHG